MVRTVENGFGSSERPPAHEPADRPPTTNQSHGARRDLRVQIPEHRVLNGIRNKGAKTVQDLRRLISGTAPTWSTSYVGIIAGRHGCDGAIIVRNIPGSVYEAVRSHVREMVAAVRQGQEREDARQCLRREATSTPKIRRSEEARRQRNRKRAMARRGSGHQGPLAAIRLGPPPRRHPPTFRNKSLRPLLQRRGLPPASSGEAR